jgi:hypothetical protein
MGAAMQIAVRRAEGLALPEGASRDGTFDALIVVICGVTQRDYYILNTFNYPTPICAI